MASDTQLNLGTVLPEALDEKDACVRRLTAGLRSREGVLDAHVRQGQAGALLCVHSTPRPSVCSASASSSCPWVPGSTATSGTWAWTCRGCLYRFRQAAERDERPGTAG